MLENIRVDSWGSIPHLRMPSLLPHDLCPECNTYMANSFYILNILFYIVSKTIEMAMYNCLEFQNLKLLYLNNNELGLSNYSVREIYTTKRPHHNILSFPFLVRLYFLSLSFWLTNCNGILKLLQNKCTWQIYRVNFSLAEF